MLIRFRYRRDFRLIARCLSDKKSSDNDSKTEAQTVDDKKKVANQKIQELLKAMLTAKPKMSATEYKEKFTVASERKRMPQEDEYERKSEKIEESLTKAAGDVAQAIGGDVKQTEAELLSKVLGKINQTSTSLSDLITGMKIDRNMEKDDVGKETRGQQVKRLVSKPRIKQDRENFVDRKTRPMERIPVKKSAMQQITSIDIFNADPLNIFKPTKEPNYGTKLETWESLKQRELNLAISQPPANYFQKMILWTDQGKIWKFPIDNEQGLEEEQSVHFSEHIFLDTHLEDWCPKKGPIRHFMELVCVGLSKNAFYTVKEKKDHIMWYKEYFESKKDILTEVGAWDVPPRKSEAST